jgi:hypothetical protein
VPEEVDAVERHLDVDGGGELLADRAGRERRRRLLVREVALDHRDLEGLAFGSRVRK